MSLNSPSESVFPSRSGSRPVDGTPLSLRKLFAGRRLIVVGGTGFLGKVWLALVLDRYPDIGQIYLVVRPKGEHSSEERFQKKIITSEVFHPLRQKYGDDFESFISEKITPISGDVALPLCGTTQELREALVGKIAAVVNVAGIVDFAPPLDEALQVNAFGCQNLVALSRELGGVPLLHTSTCFTAGSRTGPIEELDPREIPFPRAGELDISDWDPDREISECLDVIEQARHRAGDAFRQSRFLDEAKANLRALDEPTYGQVLTDELAKVKRRFVETQLAELGVERAKFWGWPNTYTYTKSIGEQIIASSGLPFTIVRPAIVESTNEFPFPGWNEGINTSAAFIFLIREGGLQLPGSNNNLDMIPCDMVCAAIILALGELLEGSARPVYQAAASDTNPCTMARFFELSGLHKRRLYKKTGKGGPVVSEIQSRFETALLNKEQYAAYGPHRIAQGAEFLGSLAQKASAGPLKQLFRPAAEGLNGFAAQQRKLAKIMDTFLPFTAEYQYVFKTDAVYSAYARLSDEEQKELPWGPDTLDWRVWFLDVHAPALERHVFPELEKRLKKKTKAPRRHESLTLLLDGMAERHDLKVALCRTEQEGLSRLSYRDLRNCALRVSAKLGALGVGEGDRVLLAGKNHPGWPIAFFGILYAGATVVPFDCSLDRESVVVIASASKAKAAIFDRGVSLRLGDELELPLLELEAGVLFSKDENALEPQPFENELAALIYTSGTTGTAKGVMLSHANLTGMIASLAPIFPLSTGDRVLSVLPLHHTFELTCGLLLPISRGARIIYLDELNADRLSHGLKESRATALVGVPALWEMLERRIFNQVAEKGALVEKTFEIAVEMSRVIGRTTGVDVGRTLFGAVHEGLGGHLKYLVSGGAALNSDTHSLFQGLGLHLAEGYGLTEASPVLTVAQGGPGARAGHVGRAIPGVEIRIEKPNDEGVGQVLARGPNVMMGYSDNPEETASTIDADGWLRTGDLGRLDARARLTLVGRAKDVVVASNGENIYPDDVEVRLGLPDGVEELCVLGVPDGRGGERLACVAVAKKGEDEREHRHRLCREAVKGAAAKLPPVQRPVIFVVVDDELPRTSTKKVKRNELRRLVEGASSGASIAPIAPGEEVAAEAKLLLSIQSIVATISRRRPTDVLPTMTLRGDLGFDSLMALELLVGLETKLGGTLDGEELAEASTVAELCTIVGKQRLKHSSLTQTIIADDKDEPITIPKPLRAAAMEWLGRGQSSFYEQVMRTKVTGRNFIPYNQRTLVVANHESHLDMGLVKFALGSYGSELVTLAAQDYFFEGNRYRKAYFDQLTNLVPMARSGSLRGALREAGDLLDRGKTVLIFPEGTRGSGGVLRPFKPAMGYLALHHSVDILPIWLEGTAHALPKGSAFPRSRNIEARIGRPLSIAKLREVTQGLNPTDSSRVISRIAHMAVDHLRRSRSLDLNEIDVAEIRRSEVPEEGGLTLVFEELRRRFVEGAVEQPISYYFSLGDERWTVRATRNDVEIAKGKTVASADCVLKTTPAIFERIVRDAWVPGPNDFMTGQIKTNNVAHLLTMQKIFRLAIPTSKFEETAGA